MTHNSESARDQQSSLEEGEGGTKDCPQAPTLSWIDNNLFMSKTHINFID